MKQVNAQSEAPVEEQKALEVLSGNNAVGAALPPEQINKPAITPAQAKVDAIAALTMSAYAKAGTLVLTKDEIAQLQADFPDEAFKAGAAGKEHLIYIEHAFLRDRLNQVIGCGQWSIVPRSRWAESHTTKAGDAVERVYVEAMLIARGCFVSENIGDMDYHLKNQSTNYGDAVRGATTQALRRCCADLGIGLQAWKKDWCEGWWQRKTGKGDPARQGFQRAAATTQTTQAQTKTPAKPAVKGPTEGNRIWMIEAIGKGAELAQDYFRNIEPNPWLMPNETIAELELRFVPETMQKFDLLLARIREYSETGKAMRPYSPFVESAAKPPAKPATAPQKDPEGQQTRKPDWFFDVLCPIPHKGQKRDDYIASPDTIRSLYASTKAGNQDAQKRLWGFANHWKPEARTVGGKTYQPSAADHLFREALDAFLIWHEQQEKSQEITIQDPPSDDDDDLPFE